MTPITKKILTAVGIVFIAAAAVAGYAAKVYLVDLPDAGRPQSLVEFLPAKKPGARTVIVFVHGIIGDPQSTFTAANGAYWPESLRADPVFDDADIVVYGYGTRLFRESLDVGELGGDMKAYLASRAIPNRYERIVFLAHSMGGLITRSYMSQFQDALKAKVKMGYFFATPMGGSAIATAAQILFPNSQLANMAEGNSDRFLSGLENGFLAAGFMNSGSWYCAYEKVKIGKLIVDQQSATRLCNRPYQAIDANHVGIVKPRNHTDNPYVQFKTAYMETFKIEPAVARNSPSGLGAYDSLSGEALTEPLQFDAWSNQRSFVLANTGTRPLDWSLTSFSQLISSNEMSGRLEPGARRKVVLALARFSGRPTLTNASLRVAYGEPGRPFGRTLDIATSVLHPVTAQYQFLRATHAFEVWLNGQKIDESSDDFEWKALPGFALVEGDNNFELRVRQSRWGIFARAMDWSYYLKFRLGDHVEQLHDSGSESLTLWQPASLVARIRFTINRLTGDTSVQSMLQRSAQPPVANTQ